MKFLILLLLVVAIEPKGYAQKTKNIPNSHKDPWALKTIGMPEPAKLYPSITLSENPQGITPCADGLYVSKLTVAIGKKQTRELKSVLFHFEPDQSYHDTISPGDLKDAKLIPTPRTYLAVGQSSLTFVWPTELRRPQKVLFMRVAAEGLWVYEVWAEMKVQEGNKDKTGVQWNIDRGKLLNPITEIVGNNLYSDNPLLITVILPKGSEKCIKDN
jgi:hypothetical protein